MKKIISGIIFVILIIGFIVLGRKEYRTAETTDNVLFSAEYQEIDENNIFTYTNAPKVLSTLRNGSGIIFFGFKSNIWAGYYANILNSAAMDLGVTEIYYYDFLEDRKNTNGTYQSIVELLNDYVVVLDDGTKIGAVIDITQSRTDIFTVKKDNGKILRFPFLKDLLIKMDLENKTVILKAKRFGEVVCYED